MLRSIDLGAMEEVKTYEELRDFAKVGSPFSIPKAALVLAGSNQDFQQNVMLRWKRSFVLLVLALKSRCFRLFLQVQDWERVRFLLLQCWVLWLISVDCRGTRMKWPSDTGA